MVNCVKTNDCIRKKYLVQYSPTFPKNSKILLDKPLE